MKETQLEIGHMKGFHVLKIFLSANSITERGGHLFTHFAWRRRLQTSLECYFTPTEPHECLKVFQNHFTSFLDIIFK